MCPFLPSAMKKGTMLRTLLVLTGIAMVLIGLIYSYSHPSEAASVESENTIDGAVYYVTVDAGSSGSRVQIYRKLQDGRMQENDPNFELKVSPGLSSMDGKTAVQIAEYIKPLLEFANSSVPSSAASQASFNLMATAGMRLLPIDSQQKILKAVCNAVSSMTAFIVTPCDEHVQVIEGKSEGVYGWVGLNYLMGTLLPGKTVGFLDMGGASAQISYEPSAQEQLLHANDLMNFTIDGHAFSIYSTSFLGYGANEAHRRYLNLLAAKDSSETIQYDHCLPRGLSLTDSTGTAPIQLRGTGNFSQCLSDEEHLLNKNAPCPDKPCLFDGVHAPKIDYSSQTFVGVSEYWYSMEEVFDLGGAFSLSKVIRKAATFCATDWSDMQKQYPKIDSEHLRSQCFKAAWVVTMLKNGFGMPDGSDSIASDGQDVAGKSVVFQSVDKVHGQKLTWTMGAAIYLSNLTPLDQGGLFPVQRNDIKLLPLILFILILCFAMIVRWLFISSRHGHAGDGSGVQAWLTRRSYSMLPGNRDLEAPAYNLQMLSNTLTPSTVDNTSFRKSMTPQPGHLPRFSEHTHTRSQSSGQSTASKPASHFFASSTATRSANSSSSVRGPSTGVSPTQNDSANRFSQS